MALAEGLGAKSSETDEELAHTYDGRKCDTLREKNTSRTSSNPATSLATYKTGSRQLSSDVEPQVLMINRSRDTNIELSLKKKKLTVSNSW